MGFGSEYLDYFHYSDSMGYLIFCCHTVAIDSTIAEATLSELLILYQMAYQNATQ